MEAGAKQLAYADLFFYNQLSKLHRKAGWLNSWNNKTNLYVIIC